MLQNIAEPAALLIIQLDTRNTVSLTMHFFPLALTFSLAFAVVHLATVLAAGNPAQAHIALHANDNVRIEP